MKIEVNKIITLGNKEKYLVIDKVVKDGKDYFYVAEEEQDYVRSLICAENL